MEGLLVLLISEMVTKIVIINVTRYVFGAAARIFADIKNISLCFDHKVTFYIRFSF